MAHRPAQRRCSAVRTRGTVGRCCQRHALTGQVSTDWYPPRMDTELFDNSCYQGTQFGITHNIVARRFRRATVSCASDNFPVQRSQLCAGTTAVISPSYCNFRYELETEYITRYPENWGPDSGKGERGLRERVRRFDDEDRTPFDSGGAVSEVPCSFRPAAAQSRGGASA